MGLSTSSAAGITRTTSDPQSDSRLSMAIGPFAWWSRDRPPALAGADLERFAAQLADASATEHGVEVVNVGSAGAKVAELLAGRADAYVHDSGSEWDAKPHHWQLPSTMGWPPGRRTEAWCVLTTGRRGSPILLCLPGLAPFLIG